ncbi:MAG: CocE/NonD family hydrolase, partial [Bryobacteraceae bacterium]
SAEQDIAGSDLPVQLVTGYYDFFHHDTVQDFFRLRARASKAPVQLILGPWTHGGSSRTKTQDYDFGPNARLDIAAANLEWFDAHVKRAAQHAGQHAGQPRVLPLVRYFVLGENRWRNADNWPPAESIPASVYLRTGKKASFEQPAAGEPADSFSSDPSNPVPSIPPGRRDISRAALWSPMDYTAVSEREDVLSWTTNPLEKPLVFAGPLKAELWVEADTKDADWIVKLFAVPPRGMALPLAHGIARGSFASAPPPGRRGRITVDLGSTAASVSSGHRLRIEIAGSSFPMYDRNLNTGEGPFGTRTAVARQKVYHEPAMASRIILPVLPE